MARGKPAASGRPLNVLDLRDTTEIGGPGKTILETVRAIDRERFNLHVAVFLRTDESGETPFVAAARQYGVPVHELRGSHQYDPRLITRTAALADRLSIDIVHAHEVKSDVIAYAASPLMKSAIVTTLHGWIGNSAKQRALIALDKQVVKRFDCLIAVSQQIQRELVDAGAPAERVRLVHNAIVLDNYQRRAATGYTSELIGRPLRGPLLVCIGRLSAEKGHTDLIDALARMVSLGHPFTAVFAGDGPERQPLLDQIRACGLVDAVHLPGYIAEPQRLLNEAQLMILPSLTEGLPNIALESLAMGVPVLATRVGGTPEVISDGDTGCLVNPGRPDELAAALARFLSNPSPWTVMAERGREMVQTRFDFKHRTRKLEEIYSEIGARAT